MSVSLPYRFDTTVLGKIIFKAAVILAIILLPGIIKFLVLANWPGLAGIIFIYLFLFMFAHKIFTKMGGASGVITPQEVTVQPSKFFGFRSNEPEGRFSLTRFSGLRVEWVSRVQRPGVQMTSGFNESVYLQGTAGTPDISIARFTDGSGKRFAEELGALLALPVEVKTGPGQIKLGSHKIGNIEIHDTDPYKDLPR